MTDAHSRSAQRSVTILVAAALLSTTADASTVLYVDDDAVAGGDGLTWNTAYRFLQDALADAAASGGTVGEVRVAQGVYVPDRDESHLDGSGERGASFELVDGVELLGGFAGVGAVDPDERDFVLFETILSGDLAGDDGPGNSENSYTVVRSIDTGEMTVLEGFTITGGNADGSHSSSASGGGMRNSGGSPVVAHCVFTANNAKYTGGGVHTYPGAPSFINCTISDNTAGLWGAGMAGGGFELISCRFEGNLSLRRAGGLSAWNFSAIDCDFSQNVAFDYGGAMLIWGGGDSTLAGCRFDSNIVGERGAAVVNQGSADLTACTFTNNVWIADGGAAIYNEGGLTLTDGLIVATNQGGQPSYLNGEIHNHEGALTLNRCTILLDHESGVLNDAGYVSVTGCMFRGGSGLYNLPGSEAVVIDSEFVGCNPGMTNRESIATISGSTFAASRVFCGHGCWGGTPRWTTLAAL
jgi:hypothetical protein